MIDAVYLDVMNITEYKTKESRFSVLLYDQCR